MKVVCSTSSLHSRSPLPPCSHISYCTSKTRPFCLVGHSMHYRLRVRVLQLPSRVSLLRGTVLPTPTQTALANLSDHCFIPSDLQSARQPLRLLGLWERPPGGQQCVRPGKISCCHKWTLALQRRAPASLLLAVSLSEEYPCSRPFGRHDTEHVCTHRMSIPLDSAEDEGYYVRDWIDGAAAMICLLRYG